MNAVLLAAGKGTRISKYVGDRPKSTLDINGTPLIRNTAELLLDNNIEVAVVIGYKKEMVIDCLSGLPIKFYENPFYDVTNSIASLWFAKNELQTDNVIIANADVFWEQNMMNEILNTKLDQVMFMDTSRSADYLFLCEGTKLIKHGKELKKYTGEYVGLAKISEPFITMFRLRLEELINNQQHGLWWENIIYSFINDLIINVTDIKGIFWSEIDYIEDYFKILTYLEKNNKLSISVRL